MTRIGLIFLLVVNIYGAPTELGNGNDGKDLIEFIEIKDGKIWEARAKAVELLSNINLRGIQGLGFLKEEVENSKLYITKEGLTSQELLNLGAFKSGDNPIVYARTFPRPHAATRFFPAARSLSEAQLVSVNIHEGLHRALPKEIRTNEKIVEEITKTLTSPSSTFEDIVATMNVYLPQDKSYTRSNTDVPLVKEDLKFVENKNRAISGDHLISVYMALIEGVDVDGNSQRYNQFSGAWAYQVRDNIFAEIGYGRSIVNDYPTNGLNTSLSTLTFKAKYTFAIPFRSFIQPYIGYERRIASYGGTSEGISDDEYQLELERVSDLERNRPIVGLTVLTTIYSNFLARVDLGVDSLNFGLSYQF